MMAKVNFNMKTQLKAVVNNKDEDQVQLKLEKKMIADHALQYMIEPVLISEERYKFYTKRRNMSRMEMLALIRARIGFF